MSALIRVALGLAFALGAMPAQGAEGVVAGQVKIATGKRGDYHWLSGVLIAPDVMLVNADYLTFTGSRDFNIGNSTAHFGGPDAEEIYRVNGVELQYHYVSVGCFWAATHPEACQTASDLVKGQTSPAQGSMALWQVAADVLATPTHAAALVFLAEPVRNARPVALLAEHPESLRSGMGLVTGDAESRPHASFDLTLNEQVVGEVREHEFVVTRPQQFQSSGLRVHFVATPQGWSHPHALAGLHTRTYGSRLEDGVLVNDGDVVERLDVLVPWIVSASSRAYQEGRRGSSDPIVLATPPGPPRPPSHEQPLAGPPPPAEILGGCNGAGYAPCTPLLLAAFACLRLRLGGRGVRGLRRGDVAARPGSP